MGVPQVPAPQRIIPIDEVELGVGNIVYKDRVELRKNDAKKQEGIVDVIATILEQSCHSNDSLQNGMVPGQITVFHGQRPPNISPRQYIERIATYSGCSPCCLAMGMKYLDKLREKDAMYELNSLNFHRLVLTATLIASKFVDDFYYSNGYWAKVGGVKVDELNGMETEFLFLISFDLHIKRSDYDAFVSELYKRAQATEDLSRRVAGLSIRTSPSGATASAPPWEGPRSPYMIQQAGGGAPPGHPAAVTPISGHPWGPETASPNLQGGPMQVGPSGGLTAGGPQGMLQQQQGVGGGGAGGAGGGVGGGGGAPPPPPPQREMPREMQVPSPHILTGSGVNYAPHMPQQGPDSGYSNNGAPTPLGGPSSHPPPPPPPHGRPSILGGGGGGGGAGGGAGGGGGGAGPAPPPPLPLSTPMLHQQQPQQQHPMLVRHSSFPQYQPSHPPPRQQRHMMHQPPPPPQQPLSHPMTSGGGGGGIMPMGGSDLYDPYGSYAGLALEC